MKINVSNKTSPATNVCFFFPISIGLKAQDIVFKRTDYRFATALECMLTEQNNLDW